MVEQARLLAAYEKVRHDLLSQRVEDGYWIGHLSSSALATATAVSALALVERYNPTDAHTGRFLNESRQSLLSELIVRGLHWLARHQNEDGGWGDTDRSHSNIAATMLVVAAFHLTGVPADHADLLQRAERYIETSGGVAALRRRYGKDKTFAVPILTNCAFAGMVSWKQVSALPFELACLPQQLYRWARLPVVSFAVPALVAIGQASYFHGKPINPLKRLLRGMSVQRSLDVLVRMLPRSGGYLEAIPLTSFVVMSLAGTGRASHHVTQQGVEFLLSTARDDGSWPIDTNLATWNTTLAINALATGRDKEWLHPAECLDWLLQCQHNRVHPFTGAATGGWGWSDLSGAVPDVDDTAGALLALDKWRTSQGCESHDQDRIGAAAAGGLQWLLSLQNSDGGWPTFCRGWGKLPFDRSGADLTAHALRALHAWRDQLEGHDVARAVAGGLRYLARKQRADGSWTPLWFGNQDHPLEENSIYGTSKVVMAYRDLGHLETESAARAFHWLRGAQQQDGGWGCGPLPGAAGKGALSPSSVEETALAVEALLAAPTLCDVSASIHRGLDWLVAAVEQDRLDASPIGFYFAKLWYYEKLYPLVHAASALGSAVRRWVPSAERQLA